MMTPRIILDSSDADASWRFVAGEPLTTLVFDGVDAIARDAGGTIRLKTADPFEALRWMEQQPIDADTRWIGYIGYEFARFVETLPATTQDDLRVPLFAFALLAAGSAQMAETDGRPAHATLRSRSLTREEHLGNVRRAIDYIAAGDIFQVNLAQRLSFACDASPRDVWDRLDVSRHGALLEFGDFSILSNSPELFFRIEPQRDRTRRIVSRPIKGTRPRRPGMDAELLASAKDRAELAMIVDLQRNDLGRVCEIGSVAVREPRAIEAHAGVYHTVATIDGTLRRDAGFADVVRALFPCGSITGCPKVRAMQIIDELEPVVRGPYCGAIGYLAADGSAEFNVAIRTMILKDGVAHVYVGGGIVADSTPAGEYDETLVKARAMLDALNVREID